jgi:ADP-ribose pyrophosphatase YjhB (NUDIX family)
VCAVVRRSENPREILLMRRSDNGHWGLPGGYVEPGESVQAAAVREVREETGFEVEIGRLVGVYSDPKSVVIDYGNRRRVQAINLCFEAVARERGEATTPQETLDVGFFEVARLPQPFVPIHEIRVRDAERGGADVAVR